MASSSQQQDIRVESKDITAAARLDYLTRVSILYLHESPTGIFLPFPIHPHPFSLSLSAPSLSCDFLLL